ncbi:MAG: sigma-70 family RNA polymerase sigma factor [Thermoleophilia bacterium]|jgi:RNA polymerase sigma-70 factor (ECF subfamily)|nr:sigma-70 family RNA polymerase sigma factor [Thermoleophilia bacterium]
MVGDPGESRIIEALRQGDEHAFAAIVDRHHGTMLRLARIHTGSQAVAEEVVQEAWLGVIRGIDRFEGRSSLRTWILRITVNTAKTRAVRERRTIPFSAWWDPHDDRGEPAVDAERFLPADHDRWPGHWAVPPRAWAQPPEGALMAAEVRDLIGRAIDALPPAQREVITLRDVDGVPAEDVCAALGVSEGNQRVLLHRARSRVRRELERYLDG